MSNIIELFGKGVDSEQDWASIVAGQQCPFLGKRCYKVRKSHPGTDCNTSRAFRLASPFEKIRI